MRHLKLTDRLNKYDASHQVFSFFHPNYHNELWIWIIQSWIIDDISVSGYAKPQKIIREFLLRINTRETLLEDRVDLHNWWFFAGLLFQIIKSSLFCEERKVHEHAEIMIGVSGAQQMAAPINNTLPLSKIALW